MKVYKDTLANLCTTSTPIKHINNLDKIKNKTEDQSLIKYIEFVVSELTAAYNRSSSKARSTLMNLSKANNEDIKNLIEYCNAALKNEKPEWQVEAERQGWTPPQGK
ncbi:hypothetical protein OKT22_03840 [Providencia rettgeri]|uniref:hypothetical protein n=1 Tax=Providencia rettgeri TaxID=587 RepID=UPI00226E72B2|nr:hypothetical protein [Providencia rettgeri]MCX9108160.1 hypothetical protein [Providencia rettgeri]